MDLVRAVVLAVVLFAAGLVALGFRVADVDHFCADCAAQGVAVTQPPTAPHGHRIARLRYPDGSEFSVSGAAT